MPIGAFRALSRSAALLALVALAISAAPAGAQQTNTYRDAPYTINPGDTLSVSVWKEPDLSGPVLVRPDGTFSIPLAGQIDGRDKTVAQLQQLIAQRLHKYIADPVVTVSVQDVKGNKVYVIGQVSKPGEFVVNPRVDVMQALSMAGGTTPFAALNGIVILRRMPDGQQQAIPFHYKDVASGRDLRQDITLQAGDVVVVP